MPQNQLQPLLTADSSQFGKQPIYAISKNKSFDKYLWSATNSLEESYLKKGQSIKEKLES